ncbi:MAG: bacteriohemerythrin [Treponema sp.]|jgi:hemerythrin|nr:bacteriohemerythrin [Treponema sp.]
MTEKSVVQWQNSYSVGIKLIDEQHKELIRLTNKLSANCMADRQKSMNAFHDTIREAVDYTGYHFGTEEKMMERVKYPEYSVHKSEHADFIREVSGRIEEFKPGNTLAPIQFVYFLRDWVLHHIAMSDKKLGDFLLYLSKNGELHKMTLMVKKDCASNRTQIR